MEKAVKRIGYLPRKRVLEIIDQISKSESISRSKVVGILVEEALDARGIANFGFGNLGKSNIFNSENSRQKAQSIANPDDEFVDDRSKILNSIPKIPHAPLKSLFHIL